MATSGPVGDLDQDRWVREEAASETLALVEAPSAARTPRHLPDAARSMLGTRRPCATTARG
eukprot:7780137-Pyramimonas_sp.AAC.1